MSGTVEAAVGGGISKYKAAFLTTDYIDTHPDDVVLVNQLKSTIVQLVSVKMSKSVAGACYASTY